MTPLLQEAILENDLSVSVYQSNPPFTHTQDLTESRLSSIFYFARNALNRRNGSMAIMNDAASGDPARCVLFSQLTNIPFSLPIPVELTHVRLVILGTGSNSLGVAVILGNLTNADTGILNVTFASAASDEVQFLLTAVPRAPNGAISHRVNEVMYQTRE